MRNAVTVVVIVLACVAGLWLAAVDTRTDDTGVEAGLIFLRNGAFPAGIVALGFAIAGALVGAYLGIIARRGVSSSRA